MRGSRSTENLIAVTAATCEAAINAGGTPDTTLQMASGDMLTVERQRETDAEEMTGTEEATRIYDLGKSGSSGNFTFDKCQPHQAAFLAAFALGKCETSALGTGYEHVITPLAGDVDAMRSLPTFAAAQRLGNSIVKTLFSGLVVDSLTMTAAPDAFLKVSGSIKGTGKTEEDIVSETVSALDNVTELTLDSNGVFGADAQGRIDSIHQVRVELTSGVWTPLPITAASDATPAVITIESAGGAGSETVKYQILYKPATEAAWMTFPAKVQETGLRTADTIVQFGGAWDGSTFEGGETLTCKLKNLEWSFNNNSQTRKCFGQSAEYAGEHFRDGRSQTVKLDFYKKDMSIAQMVKNNETFGLRIVAEGAEFDEVNGHKYAVEVIFPKLGFNSHSDSVDGKRMAESAECQVLEDETYGSVIVKIRHAVSGYAAAA